MTWTKAKRAAFRRKMMAAQASKRSRRTPAPGSSSKAGSRGKAGGRARTGEREFIKGRNQVAEVAGTAFGWGVWSGGRKVATFKNRAAAMRKARSLVGPTTRRNAQLLTLYNPATRAQVAQLLRSPAWRARLAAAAKAYREFHGVDPRELRIVPGGPDRALVAMGDLREVVYRPTRGARRGPAFFHKFGKGAVLAATVDGRDLVNVPGEGRPFVVKWDRGIVG